MVTLWQMVLVERRKTHRQYDRAILTRNGG
jgi:hypothetical protein